MTDEINATLSSAMLHKITADVFQSVVGIEVEQGVPENSAMALDLSAMVRFEDGGQGAVIMELSSTLAQKLSSIMLCLDDSETDDTLVQDAIGEIVNIIAGHYKAARGSSLRLSMPKVIFAPATREQCPPEYRSALLCAEETFFVGAWIE
ncbi:CheY-specific phosphatase CheX [Silvibacterium bohemicum]|uniref:CheY-specific phosphatase CheX n=1 Tax=Silvibacterium bohemicum TaxID=1577686 RepID=A0A841JZV9_9BACT|nr:chemotaxis protein CheX [Silvibacterium bohemicum]MBB6147023.1 CheY-specific phosphatase CheX [Silvibacterium bohemicum]